MKNEIEKYIDDPKQLEKLYRSNKTAFKKSFNTIQPSLESHPATAFWSARLHYESDDINWGSRQELLVVIVVCVVAGFIAKLPALLHINEEFFYTRNIGFVIFPVLSAYFSWKNRLPAFKILFIAATTLVGLIFINLFPDVKKSDTLILSCVHLVLVLWAILGFAFVANENENHDKWLGYLKYNGDLVVMTGLILIAGAILTGVTLGLFSLIGFQIENFYFNWIAIFGLAAAPVVGTYLTQTNPHLVGKVSPVIAKIFSPLVLVMLVIYLIAIVYTHKDPYNNRDFLLIFNALLIGVMAIIFFSVAGTSSTVKSRSETWILFMLSLVTVVVNGIALSAILFRISEWGVTPNRAAILGGNMLILINLLLVTRQLYQAISKKTDTIGVGKSIASYLPVYVVWAVIVTFIFPIIFAFK
jgi:hypothetical protein